MAHVKQPKQPAGANLVPRIFQLFEDKRRYLLIGEISLDTQYRLDTVEWTLEQLVMSGSVRHLTPEEKKLACLHPLVVAYVKTKPGHE